MTPTCGRGDCRSPCHTGTPGGRYCAPQRCYCGACPSYEPLPERTTITAPAGDTVHAGSWATRDHQTWMDKL